MFILEWSCAYIFFFQLKWTFHSFTFPLSKFNWHFFFNYFVNELNFQASSCNFFCVCSLRGREKSETFLCMAVSRKIQSFNIRHSHTLHRHQTLHCRHKLNIYMRNACNLTVGKLINFFYWTTRKMHFKAFLRTFKFYE